MLAILLYVRILPGLNFAPVTVFIYRGFSWFTSSRLFNCRDTIL